MKRDNNYTQLLTHSHIRTVLTFIKSIKFTIDLMTISIRYRGIDSTQFLNLLQKKYSLTNSTQEMFTKSKGWSRLFKKRTFFTDHYSSSLMALTIRATPLANIDALLVLNNPSLKTIVALDDYLKANSNHLSYSLSRCEFAFDFLTEDISDLALLQQLFRKTAYFAYGRVAFKQGSFPTVTDYINSRKSVKQLKIYKKHEDYDCLRVEFSINRRKAYQQGLLKPRDLVKYRINILNELKFYQVKLRRMGGTLFNTNCDGYYLSHFWNIHRRKGFHHAQLWAKSLYGCPKACQYFNTGRCRKIIFKRAKLNGKATFQMIVKCPYAVRLVNFRRDYCILIPELEEVKRLMFKAFKQWKR